METTATPGLESPQKDLDMTANGINPMEQTNQF